MENEELSEIVKRPVDHRSLCTTLPSGLLRTDATQMELALKLELELALKFELKSAAKTRRFLTMFRESNQHSSNHAHCKLQPPCSTICLPHYLQTTKVNEERHALRQIVWSDAACREWFQISNKINDKN